MIAKPLKIAALLFATSSASLCLAQMDVDQADSLNFEAFHKDKKEAVKVWKDDKAKKDETVKAYDQNATTAPAATTTRATTPAATTLTSTPVTSDTAASASTIAATKPGQHFEIRERYTLTRSAKTPYSAFYVIESLHQQSAKLCPKGWKKLTERSVPVEQDFYMFYEIECL